MPNPLVAQGTLNRVRGSIVWPSFPQLNVTAPFLGKNGISLTFEGEATQHLPTMTGAVTSGEPYLMASISIELIKSQAFSDLYKAKMELDALMGDCTVRPDSATLSPFQIINCAIKRVGDLKFNGEELAMQVVCGGYYLVNSSLFDGV